MKHHTIVFSTILINAQPLGCKPVDKLDTQRKEDATMKKKRETRCTLCNDKTLATAFGRYVEAFEPHAKCGDEETLAATRVPSAARATPKLSGTPPASRGRPAQPRPTPRSLRTPPRPDRHQRQEGHTRGQPRERVCTAAGHPLAEPVTEAAEHSPSHVRPCLHDSLGGSVPAPVPDAIETMRALHQAIQGGLVHACHDLSEGGLAVAAAEMAFAGRLGMELDLADLPRAPEVTADDVALFSESSARFLVEVASKEAAEFEKALAGKPVAQLGHSTDTGVLLVRGLSGSTAIDCPAENLLEAWQSTEVV